MNKQFNSKSYSGAFNFSNIDVTRIRFLLEMIGDKKKKILDIGCGDGTLMEPLIANKHTVIGLDISGPALTIAKKKGLNVKDLDLTSDWSEKITDKFDVVLAGEIIEHVFDTDKFLVNINNVLKKGGHLVLSTPNIASLPRRIMLLLGFSPYIETTARSYDAGHIRYFTFNSLKALLDQNGFQVIEQKSDGINLDSTGNLYINFIVRKFPSLGRSLIVKAKKL
jgi:methionine biosynthesis protein MetW